jgi:hypothetical protein
VNSWAHTSAIRVEIAIALHSDDQNDRVPRDVRIETSSLSPVADLSLQNIIMQPLIQTFRRLASVTLLALLGAAPATPTPHGQYLEARTASVFAGACHYAGERVTDGRSAVMSWKIESGSFDDIDLTGVKVIAAVSCDDNLAEASAARRTEIVVDADTDARAAAAVNWVKSQCASQFGSVENARRAPITFDQNTDGYRVASIAFASLNIRPMPDHACCVQPNMVCYEPLMKVRDRRVGYAKNVEVIAANIGDRWQRADENDAFYGQF